VNVIALSREFEQRNNEGRADLEAMRDKSAAARFDETASSAMPSQCALQIVWHFNQDYHVRAHDYHVAISRQGRSAKIRSASLSGAANAI
jgi:hypothetical protein